MNHLVRVCLFDGSRASELVKAASCEPKTLMADTESGQVEVTFDFGSSRETAQDVARAVADWFRKTGVGGMLFVHSSIVFDAKVQQLENTQVKKLGKVKLRALPGGKKNR